MKKALVWLLALFLAVYPVLGCSSPVTGKTFRYDIPYPVDSLDPQFVTDSAARTIMGNIFEGLLVQDADGKIHPGAAESYTVSSDDLTYTFTLRQGAAWSDGIPLTADDFLFAFQRMFSAQSPSPYAGDFAHLQNAQPVLQGTMPVSSLGVSAPDAATVVFQLSRPSPFFLELLTSTPALPCNREFFRQVRGRYGLERTLVLCNGPFALERWDNRQSIVLGANSHYLSETSGSAEGVIFYIGRENPTALFESGKSDLLVASCAQLDTLQAQGAEIREFGKTTWCVVFNQEDPALGNALVRQGLSYAMDRALFAGRLDGGLAAASVLVPPAMRLLDQPFREMAGSDSPLAFDAQRGAYLFSLGLNGLELDYLPPVTFLVPDTDAHAVTMSLAQQGWQRHLGAYINMEPLSPLEIEQRFAAQDYQMLLMPFSPSSPQISSLLGAFASNSSQNRFGYRSPFYDAILQEATAAHEVDDIASKYRQAEALLLGDAVVIPVYFETTYYALAKGVSGIEISPFAGKIYFKYGTKAG